MGRSTFSGPVLSGTVRDGQYRNVGNSVQVQTTAVVQAGAGTQNITLYVPATSQILRFTIDSYVAFDSVTTAALTIGTASAGTQYVSSTDMKAAAGRLTVTPTAAQLLAYSSTAVDATASAAAGTPMSAIVITLVATGTTTAGSARVSVEYAQANPQGAGV